MKTATKSDRISLAELKRLLDNLNHSDSATDKKIRIGMMLQYYTALRFGDCSRITFDDVLNNNKFELVEEKTTKSKTITVNSTLKKEVAKYFDSGEFDFSDTIIDYSIQYANRRYKYLKVKFNVKNYSDDGNFRFSTHSVRKCSLFEVYKRAGINVSLKISNHSSIDVHLKYICAEDDVKDAYMCL